MNYEYRTKKIESALDKQDDFVPATVVEDPGHMALIAWSIAFGTKRRTHISSRGDIPE